MRKIIDYCVITMECEMEINFLDSKPKPIQEKFNAEVKKKLMEGFELKDEFVIKQGNSAGLFSPTINPIISQALVKYETIAN